MIILTRAPLRIPLGGGGTDIPSYYSKYGGFLISVAINKYVYVLVNRTTVDNLIRIKYSESEKAQSTTQIRHAVFRESLKFTQIDGGIEIATMADAPTGTGLGSSGSFTVALLAALHTFNRQQVNPLTIAQQACEIEIDRAKMATGKQDQYLAALGGVVCLSFSTDDKVNVIPININPYVLKELKSNLLLFYTNISRESFAIQKEQIKNTEDNVQNVVNSLHRTKEIGLEIKRALEEGDLDKFGHLLHTHWENKKKRSSKISSSDIDRWYRIAKENGALGGKIMGAGGGGFLALYCPADARNGIRSAMKAEGLREMDYDFDTEGVKVIVNI